MINKLEPGLKGELFVNKNTAFVVEKYNPKDLIEKEIGDSKVPDKFIPQQKVMRWDNEVNFSVRLVHDEKTPDVVIEGDSVIWRGEKVEAKFYDVFNDEHPEGAGEFEVILKEKPATNVVEFSLNTKGLDFFYQKDLNDEFPIGSSDEGRIVESATETETRDPEGNVIASRGDNVVRSYAVYASENKVNYIGEKEYQTGKVGHIYRPQIEDAKGTKVWGELNIDYEKGILSVTIPQEFLDNAVYPVRHAAGLTFGYTGVGATNFESTADTIFASSVINNLAVSSTVTSVKFYGLIEGASLNMVSSVYDGTTLLSPQSSALAINSTSAQWWENSFSGPSLSSGTAYRPAILVDWASSTNSIHIFRDAATSGDSVIQTNTYPTWPNPSTWTNSSNRYSIYGVCSSTPEVFGNPNIGGGTEVGGANIIFSDLFVAPSTGTLDSMSIYVVTDGGTKLGMALYDANFDSLIAQTNEINPATGWNTATFASPPSVTAGTSYRLAFWVPDTTSINALLTGGNTIYTNDHNYTSLSGVFPANPTNEFTEVYRLSIYATYTAAGSTSPSLSPSLSPSISPSQSPSASLSPSKSPSLSPSQSPSASLSPSLSPSISPSQSPSASLSPSLSPSSSPSQSPSASLSPSISPSPSPSQSPSASLSPSQSPSASLSPSQSPSASLSPSTSPSASPSQSPSASLSPSISPSLSPSQSPSASLSPSQSPSISPSQSPSASKSPSLSPSASPSQSPSASISPSVSPSASHSQSPSASLSPSQSPSLSPSQSPSASISPSQSPSASLSPSVSPSAAPYGAVLRRWDGSQWVKAKLKTYTGSWVYKPLYVWVDEWLEVDIYG